MPCDTANWAYAHMTNVKYMDMDEKELWTIDTNGLMTRQIVETSSNTYIRGPCGNNWQSCATKWKTVSPHRDMIWATEENGRVWRCPQPCGGLADWIPEPFTSEAEAKPIGKVLGFIGIAPGSFITYATDARHVHLLSATPFGKGMRQESNCQNIVLDPMATSSRTESFWLFATCEATNVRIVKLAVTVKDGLAYLRVNGAFWSVLEEPDKFDILVAHSSWINRRGTNPNAFAVGSSGYGITDVVWEINDSGVSSFTEKDVEATGTVPGPVKQTYGSPIAFTTDVRKIILVSGAPVGSSYKRITKCGDIVPDPAMPSATADLSFWLFVTCDARAVLYLQLRVELRDGAAYILWSRAFYRFGSHDNITGINFHEAYIRRHTTLGFADSDDHGGLSVRNVKWRLDPTIISSSSVVKKGDEPAGNVTGYVGGAPGVSLVNVTDARNIRLVAIEGGGTNMLDGQNLGVIPDRTQISNENQSYWIFANRQSHWNRCVKLSVTRREDGMAYVHVDSAFRYHNASWVIGDDAFDAQLAHEMWTKRYANGRKPHPEP